MMRPILWSMNQPAFTRAYRSFPLSLSPRVQKTMFRSQMAGLSDLQMSSARQTRSSKGGIRRLIWWGLASFLPSQMPLNAARSPLCLAATAQASRSTLMTQTLHRRRFKRWRLIQRLNSILNCASQCCQFRRSVPLVPTFASFDTKPDLIASTQCFRVEA